MADVFLVDDEQRGTRLVLKQLRADTPDLLAAFRSEFALLAGLLHPRLTRVHDFGSARVRGESYHYYTAAYIEGATLRQHAREHGARQPDPRAHDAGWLRAFCDALEGLLALHELGVVHGDFTPDNILVRPDGSGVLIDLGCARPRGQVSSELSGTPGFFAPELLSSGRAELAGDLYAVGICLQQLAAASGERPSAELAALIPRLTAASPEQRPADTRSVLAALGRQAQSPGGWSVRSLRLIGRETERQQFASWLQAVLRGAARPRLLTLTGRRGAGKSRLLHELCASAMLELEVLRASGRERGSIGRLLGAASQSDADTTGARAVLDALSVLRQRAEPLLLVLEDIDAASAEDAETLAQLARSLDERSPVAVLVSGVEPTPQASAERIVLSALGPAEIAEWTQHSLSQATVAQLASESEGLPARIESALAQLTGRTVLAAPAEPLSERAARIERVARHGARAAKQGAAAPKQQGAAAPGPLAGLTPEELRRLGLLVALEGELVPAELGLDSSDFSFGFERGLLQRERDTILLGPLLELAALQQALGSSQIEESHRQLAALLPAGVRKASSPARLEAELIRHLLLGARSAEGCARLQAAEPLWRREPPVFASRLVRLNAPQLTTAAQVCLLELSLLASDPRGTMQLAARWLRTRPPLGERQQARVCAAEALTRLGRGARAARLLERVLLASPPQELRRRALLGLARARTQWGDYPGVERAAGEALQLGVEGALAALAHEALGVAALYGARLSEAEAHFAVALAQADAARGTDALSSRERCRLLGYRALCAFRAGRASRARDDHARALAVAESAGHDDLLGTCHLNLGTALQQLGELGGAHEHYTRGLAVARAIGRESTELALGYNQLNLRVELGDFERVQTELATLSARAERLKLLHYAPALALVRAEIALARGELVEAETQLTLAARGYDQHALGRERIETDLALAELALQRAELQRARELTLAAEERARTLDATDLLLRSEIAHARNGARSGDRSALERAREAVACAEQSEQLLLAARLKTELCFVAEACSAPGLPELFESARNTWDRLAAQLPEQLRQVFWADPRRAGLLRFTRALSLPQAGAGEDTAEDAVALRRLLSLSRRINSSLSLERVLEYAVEAAVQLCGAERGFLFLREPDGSPRLSTRAGAEPSALPSSSIVQRVLASGEALLTTDAGTDLRLLGSGSVHAQRLKAVLCVPVSTPSEQLGALYVDSRLERTPLSESARRLLLALADHVAVALSNAHLHAQLTRRTEELAAEKRMVERLSSNKDRQLEQLREQLEQQRRTLDFRYDYQHIKGRGERMSEVLQKLDRIIESDVNVLIQGESGTGKELIARAIHVHGARSNGPFVAVNCASIPETLLESELFGYVRGAFTGADRDKTGLLLAASGGTLFLDELGELSPATQAKLLRVLQEREVRPLGAERARPLDLRLVCATHRELGAEVAAGRFREDLFYRVAVLDVQLPALRERIEDLPELCRSILARAGQAAGRPDVELAPDALRALAGYAFPGNVRELENILTRALVLSGRSRLRAEDLELQRTVLRTRASRSREEYAREERERILHALRGARWNVSVVSRTLGIPRNTLYRKLARYGLMREVPEGG
ncbi:MAG: hypothetical protein RL685_4458 [Pseudomonadota bacterium]